MTVGIIGDTHEPWSHPQYRDFCYKTFNKYKVDRVIHIGDECFPGDVEILTTDGWIRLDSYTNEKVLQCNNDGTSEFVTPSRYVDKEHIGHIYRFNKPGFVSKTTPTHNLVIQRKKGLDKIAACDVTPLLRIPISCKLDGPGLGISEATLMMQVALSADASFGTCGIRLSFKRLRKIERFRFLAESLKLKFTESSPPKRPGYKSFYISATNDLTPYNKKFNFDWIALMSLNERMTFISELKHWDGFDDTKRNRIVYSSVIEDNAVFVQTIAHTIGMKATITKTKNRVSTTYRVNIYSKPSDTRIGKAEIIPFSGRVYCVTVPSGMVLTRQEGTISVSGNCDNHALSFHPHNVNGFSAESEAVRAQKAMEKWYKLFPKVDVMIGNHSALPYRQATAAGIPHRFLKVYEEIWSAPKGWKWSMETEIDHVLYTHGTGLSGQNGAINKAIRSRQSTVIGHIHSFGGVAYHASDKDLVFGMNVGCGIDVRAYAFEYGRTFVNKPTLGCGIVIDGHQAIFCPMQLGKKFEWVK